MTTITECDGSEDLFRRARICGDHGILLNGAGGGRWHRALGACLGALGSVVFLVASAVLSGGAIAHDGGVRMSPGEARMGTLLFKTKQPGEFITAPRLGTDIEIDVNGPTARGTITQHFQNPTDGWVEAVYVMPLAENSAVDTLKMVIGEKIIIGEIKERRKAREIYEAAKARGQKAALLTQERPNIFTHKVANIGPGETIVVQVAWQQVVPFNENRFALRVPLVVGPRFNPKPLVQTVDFGAPDAGGTPGWGKVIDPVPDRDRITPTVLDPARSAPVNPVSLMVNVNAGFDIGDLKSHHHETAVDAVDATRRVVKLKAGAEPADRDFELTWRPKDAKVPAVGLFRETVDGEDYVVAFVTPPSAETPSAKTDDETGQKAPDIPTAVRREMVFVIDNSGSMGGESIRQARDSLLFGLDRLKPGDRFNVIRFDDTYSQLFARSVAASSGNLQRARAFVSGLEASGGTMMVAPMTAALRDGSAGRVDGKGPLVRQVVFLTDGAIGNEAELMELVGARRGRSRVFMIGIGSAPNSHLMSRIAEVGRGSFIHIGSVGQVKTRMQALFEKLQAPAVTDLSVAFDGVTGDVTPSVLPDVYRGEPLVLAGKVSGFDGTVTLRGRIGARPWEITVPLKGAQPAAGISKLWARRKIRDAEIAARLRTMPRELADAEVLKLALAHGLMSRLTALVAVEREISRPEGAVLTRGDIPLNLPKGWDFEKVFGPRDAVHRERADAVPPPAGPLQDTGATGGIAREQSAGALPPTAHKPSPQPAVAMSRFAGVATQQKPRVVSGILAMHSSSQPVRLPGTATDAELRMLFGALLVLLALLTHAISRFTRVRP